MVLKTNGVLVLKCVMFGMNEKCCWFYPLNTTQVLKLFKFYLKQTIEISLLSYHLPQCPDGPTNPQRHPGCHDATAADDDGRSRSRKS